ncbi:MAG: sensor domain-containing diguanylate cyclase [Polynucleobacter sp.]|uniref:sensor domain-containing diguanylate cyclase n=1 Tax=Polynucleobacter sp. TaxID=2029855 RepID=UPI00271A64BA|nr:sensor domain-containing diguanylate cyclase [Polynucleobacter sp.]MDO8714456.1 sensor domain-containing diguanylate cyclase [Polynucleobacter sp.]
MSVEEFQPSGVTTRSLLKSATYIFIGTIFFIFIVLWFVDLRARDIRISGRESTSHTMANGIGIAIQDDVIGRDFAQLESRLRQVISDPQISSIMVADTDGVILSEIQRDPSTGEIKPTYSFKKFLAPSVEESVVSSNNFATTHWSKLKAGVPIGWLKLEIRPTPTEDNLFKLIRDVSLALLGACLFLFAAVGVVLRRIFNLIRIEEGLMADLYDNAPCGYHSLDSQGTYVRINDTELDWLGYSRKEVVGKKRFTDFLTETGKTLFQASFPKFIADGCIEDLELEYIGKNGQSRMVSLSATTIKDKHGNMLASRSVTYDITERKRLEEQLNKMAHFDTLTKLPNRQLLFDRLGQALAGKERSGLHGALMFIDLDNFKPLNDLHGHEAGDLLLIEVGRRLNARIREMDTAARIGGDEFVVFIDQLEGDETRALAQASIIAENIRLVLAEPYQISILNDKQNRIMIEHQCFSSIGIVVFSGKAKDIDVIMNAADTMMYEAKKLGRNQVRVNPAVI